MTLQLVIVTELDIERISVFEAKADAPLIIDRDGVLAGAITFQGM